MSALKKISDKVYIVLQHIFGRKECKHIYHIIDITKTFNASITGSSTTTTYVSRCMHCGNIKKDVV